MLKQWLFKQTVRRLFKLFFKLNLKPVELDLTAKKCLILAPHPDDESIGMGGTLALYPQQFDVACLSNGNKGIANVSPATAAQIRKAEFETVMNNLKIQTYFWLDISDQALTDGYATFKTLDLSCYDVIFVPNLLDQHPDHKAVSWLVYQYFKEFPNQAKPGLQLAFFEVWSALALPNAMVDISSVVNQKREMISCHASQVAKQDFAQMILSLNAYRGLNRQLTSAEAFCVVALPLFNELVETLGLFNS